jgi:hypothetical protein
MRQVLGIVGAIIFLMMIHPPYRVYEYGRNSSSIVETGYAWIFDLPQAAVLDTAALLTQWVGVLILGGVVAAYLRLK